MSEHEEVYLGDGLYASFDGYSFILRAPRDGGDHWVALEPSVLKAFDKFRQATVGTVRDRIAEMEKRFGEP